MSHETLKQQYLSAMSKVATSVNIVTTDGSGGRAGVTVSAMSSASIDDQVPYILVCVHHLSPASDKIIANENFCVNILGDNQSNVSEQFAGRTEAPGGDKFAGFDWVPMSCGSPRLADAYIALDCRLSGHYNIAEHHIFIGEVVEIYNTEKGAPLLYLDRHYVTVGGIA